MAAVFPEDRAGSAVEVSFTTVGVLDSAFSVGCQATRLPSFRCRCPEEVDAYIGLMPSTVRRVCGVGVNGCESC